MEAFWLTALRKVVRCRPGGGTGGWESGLGDLLEILAGKVSPRPGHVDSDLEGRTSLCQKRYAEAGWRYKSAMSKRQKPARRGHLIDLDHLAENRDTPFDRVLRGGGEYPEARQLSMQGPLSCFNLSVCVCSLQRPSDLDALLSPPPSSPSIGNTSEVLRFLSVRP